MKYLEYLFQTVITETWISESSRLIQFSWTFPSVIQNNRANFTVDFFDDPCIVNR